jgi:hypothetical protein
MSRRGNQRFGDQSSPQPASGQHVISQRDHPILGGSYYALVASLMPQAHSPNRRFVVILAVGEANDAVFAGSAGTLRSAATNDGRNASHWANN